MSALDASMRCQCAGRRADRARTAQATQVAAIAARLERLPLTSYQKAHFRHHRDRLVLRQHGSGRADLRARLDPADASSSRPRKPALLSQHQLPRHVPGRRLRRPARRPLRPHTSVSGQHDLLGARQLCSAACPRPSHLLGASRLLLGFGMGMEFPVAQSMVSEMMPADKRGRYIALSRRFLAARLHRFGPADLLRCCRSPTGTGSSSCRRSRRCSCWSIRRYVPESPRWLAAHGHCRPRRTGDGARSRARSPRGSASRCRPAEAADQVEHARIGRASPTLFSGIYAKRTTMLWMPVVLRAARLLRAHDLARRAAAGQGLSGHQIGVLHHPDFAGGHSRDSCSRPGSFEALGPQGHAGRSTCFGGAIACYFYGGATDQTHAHHLPASACSSSCSACGRRSTPIRPSFIPPHVRATGTGFRLGDRANRLADRSHRHRRHPADGRPVRRIRARRRRVRDRGASRTDSRAKRPRDGRSSSISH